MRRLSLLSILIAVLFSCSKKKEELIKEIPTHSVLILKNFNPTNQFKFSNSAYVQVPNEPIEITNPYDFRTDKISHFNGISDTVRIEHFSEVMTAKVTYSPLIRNEYFFRAGDTIVVDFSDLKNIKEHYLNKNVFSGDIPLIIVTDSLAYESEFFKYDKESIRKRKSEDSLKRKISERNLDSLYNQKQVYEPFYKVRKQQFEYSKKAEKYNEGNLTDLKNDTLIGLTHYQYFVRQFTAKKFDIKVIRSTNSNFLDYKTAFDSVYQSDLYGEKAKDYLLFYYLDEMIQDFSYNDFKERFDRFKQTAKDTTFVTFLEDKYLLNFTDLKKETQEIYFINSQKQKQTLSQILEENKDKVIYVDFWASWCAPCRALMSASKELHKEFKDKDVVFLYLSIDNDFEKWQKANRDEGLAYNRFSLLAVNYPNADFYKELNLRSIPRYLLYDKQGNLVHKNAPSPDSELIRETLNQLLK